MNLPDGLAYVPDFLGELEQQELRAQLDRVPFYHDTFRGKKLRREYAQFGFRYGSTARTLESTTPFPE